MHTAHVLLRHAAFCCLCHIDSPLTSAGRPSLPDYALRFRLSRARIMCSRMARCVAGLQPPARRPGPATPGAAAAQDGPAFANRTPFLREQGRMLTPASGGDEAQSSSVVSIEAPVIDELQIARRHRFSAAEKMQL